MNTCIQGSSDQNSTKGKRYLLLSTNKQPFLAYDTLGLGGPIGLSPITPEQEKQRWLNRIMQALIEKGHIFAMHKGGGGYYIQA
jgi:hypothetical protein